MISEIATMPLKLSIAKVNQNLKYPQFLFKFLERQKSNQKKNCSDFEDSRRFS